MVRIKDIIDSPQFTISGRYRVLKFLGIENDCRTEVVWSSEDGSPAPSDIMDYEVTAMNIAEDGFLEIEYDDSTWAIQELYDKVLRESSLRELREGIHNILDAMIDDDGTSFDFSKMPREDFEAEIYDCFENEIIDCNYESISDGGYRITKKILDIAEIYQML